MLLNKDKIFNEVFSNYYKVLSEIVNSEPIDELKIDEFISKRSSDDSNQFLHENFENYKFIKKIGNKWQSALESKFEQPLTNLEKSWLKALISDPKIRLFLDEEKILACQAATRAGANFVKTSTGFGSGGATPDDVELMRKNIPDTMSVKAAGGIHNYKEAMAMINAGAGRIGASAGIEILKEAE